MRRAVIIVLDGVGIGALPDADQYGDAGSNTLMHVKEKIADLQLVNLCRLGLGHIDGHNIYDKVEKPTGCYGRMAEKSAGKDTITGHWEIAGLVLEKAFPTYPNGFPDEIISAFEKKTGRAVIGNCPASGTEIIQRLGARHVKTGDIIVYTSADSVFQIAAHEDIMSVPELYRACETAREILTGEHAAARVIARPFAGSEGAFVRTKNRKDFSLPPVGPTLLDHIKAAGQEVCAIGKIEDIFANRGMTQIIHTRTNPEGVEATLEYLRKDFDGLIFTNLVDYDMLYGHRNDVQGFADALQAFDDALPELLDALHEDDLLFITADHGCDPTFPGTDHTREYVPLLVYGKKITPGRLEDRASFADLGATIQEYLQVGGAIHGKSFLSHIMETNRI